MNFIDLFSLSLHKAVAERMLLDEEAIVRTAKSNLDRWLNSTDASPHGRTALLEWKRILEHWPPADIRRLISAETDEAQRLRASSPFTGILSQQERKEIYDRCAEIIPV